MCSCLRQSFSLPRKLFIAKKNSPSKFYSSFSPVYNKSSSNYDKNKIFFTITNKPKQIQCRYFSLQNVHSFFESIRTSEAAQLVNSTLLNIHDVTGFSWSVTIIACSVFMKLFISLPCGIFQQHILSRLELTKVELGEAVKKIREAVTNKATRGLWTNEKFQVEFRKEVNAMWKVLIVKNNCHPFKITILFLAQLPFWLLLTITIRSLAMDAHAENMENPMAALQFRVGGPSWCPNLSVPDPTYILPAINFLSMLAVTEIAMSSRIQKQLKQNFASFFSNKIFPNFLRALAIVFFLISSVSPAGVSLFWTSSSVITLGQNLLLMSPRVRRVLKIPKTASEVDKPYSHAYTNFIQKFQKMLILKK